MILEELNSQIIDRLFEAGRPGTFKRGETMMRRGDPGDSMFLLVSGRVEVSLNTVFGTKSILGIYGPRTILGDIACLDGKERSADVTALEPVETLVVTRPEVLRLLEEDGKTSHIVIEALCQKVRNATDVLEFRVLTTARARLANALIRLMEDDSEPITRIRVSQRWLGNYSGLTRENVNRQLGAWAKDGVAQFEQGEVVILDKDRLIDAALNDQGH
ncbi:MULTISPECIES: Crp/Fnr family transcriptional regulator [unclassified Roseovarius]|uniref:Crp/Fnr family transcriptional regulator n=1 Tax=unclassified Roseovarius TaxID=2614913 RepID=UPI00273F3494|nr:MULTISPECIES: Crp/Fnr family transcriptional regulator [unclassified Roseovarius]